MTSRLSFISALLLPLLIAGAAAQVSVGTEVLGLSFGGTTYYGEFRTYSATIIAVGVGTGTFAGNLTFICGTTVIAQAPLMPTAAVQVSPNQLASSLQISLLNQVIAQNGLVLGGINLGPILGIVGGITTVTAQNLNTPAVQTLLNSLSPITVNAAAVASVTTPYTPVINCTAATVVYSAVTLGGQPVLGAPTLNPLLPLTAFSFQVLPTPTSVSLPSGNVVSAPFNSTFVLPVSVTNADPNSVLPPNGGTVIVKVGSASGRKLLQGTVIGTGPVIAAATGLTSTALVLVSTGPPLVAGTTAVLQVLFGGNVDFLPSFLPNPGYSVVITGSGTSPQTGSTTPPTSSLPPPSSFTTAVTVAVAPTSAFVGTPVTVSGAVTSTGGHPTGTIVVTNNGITLPAVPVDPTTGAYTLTTTAPSSPGVDVITATFIPTPGSSFQPSPTHMTPLLVTLPGTTFTNLTGTPSPAIAGAPLTLTGTVTAANGAAPTGTVQALVNGVPVNTIVPLVPGTGSSIFSLPITAPGTVGPANVTFLYIPGPGFAGPSTLPSLQLAVTGAPPTIAVTTSPTPAAPGGNLTVSGSISSTGAGAPAGTVTVTLNGQTYTAAVTPGTNGVSTFSLVVPAPANAGTFPLGVAFTPAPGSSTAAGSVTRSIVVSGTSLPVTANANAGLAITFGGGATNASLSFPNCRTPLVIGVSTTVAPGLGYTTGNVTLAVTGGGLGANVLTFGSASLSSGGYIFTVNSADIHHDILVEIVAKLGSMGLAHQHELNPALVPAGHILLLPGDYTLEITYSGDNSYASAVATIPLHIAAGCGLADLYL